ncbi:MAG: DUF5132 domain-containing protein [Nitrococcus sp.]|nr:DUF5132 domain-containing protein [Nitrococcus sp.]
MSLGDLLFGEIITGEVAGGVALGVGAAILAPVVLAAASGAGRPLMRAAVKSGIVFYEKGREVGAELGEVVEDFVAEVRAEYATAGYAASAPSTSGQSTSGQAMAVKLTPVQAEVAATVNEAVQEAETKYARE